MLIFCKKNADISKIKKALGLKSIFCETKYGCVLRTKFQVSSIILTSFRQGVFLPPPPSPESESLQSPATLGLNSFENYSYSSLQ